MIVGCVLMLSSAHPHGIAWFLFLLGQGLARMAWIFREPPGNRQPPYDWRNGPVLSSQRWGER
jgi:hypothetical protein